MRMCILLAGIALCATTAFADPEVTEVVTPQRPAAELLGVLRPLAGDDVSVQAWQGQLVLHGPADRVAALKAVLEQVDRPLHDLRISVRRHDDDSVQRSSLAVQSSGRARLQQETHAQSAGDVQSLVLAEGTVAHLSLDTEIPVLGTAPSGATTTGFVALGNGLDLAPTLAGDRVRVEIRRRDARVAGTGVAAQTVQSVLLLVPGEWTVFAALDGRGGEDRATVRGGRDGVQGAHTETGRGDLARWDIRVDVLDP